ncbi:beta-galactosidase [Nitzschia inconspicua]|uniref:Beta-galactosidase n=1 Tax=Nitzschia inconspicua TaxID=303405 RepID=A0A9K3KNU9_9STRA|nr:beta-galactosidase [Nitzschia inconspicua]
MANIHVPLKSPGFPSFLDYAHKGSIKVTYDNRSLKLNGERVFFLGGSMHPSRATQQTWNMALNEAVQNGLNLITIYVMWADHQPFPDQDIDWSFQKGIECQSPENRLTEACDWSLAAAIRSAANRGLFVHLRLGPYTCAEYSYGGIPPWLPLQKPNMHLRRPNSEWLEVMESWVQQTVEYIRSNRLWAYQAGPVILAQIENELAGNDMDLDAEETSLLVDIETGQLVEDKFLHNHSPGRLRKATLQDYADWCGAIAMKLEPNVTWTMCSGLTANNTIHTCNSQDTGAEWLENYGENGRIQVDQPPLFTEFEEGFQDWGERPEEPSDYFWGRTARDSTRHALRWFARGGTHLNYYMFWGSYNRAQQPAGGITNFYASEAALCSSGQRHEPKFSHYAALHRIMKSIAPTLLAAPSALWMSKKVNVLDINGKWTEGLKQRAFEYFVQKSTICGSENMKHVFFFENDANEKVVVDVNLNKGPDTTPRKLTMAPLSALILVDGILEFDSASIDPKSMSFKREFVDASTLLDWSSWPEPVGTSRVDEMTWTDKSPIEQTRLNVGSGISSQYSWYETTFNVSRDLQHVELWFDSQRSNGLLVFVDGRLVGDTEDHSHLYEGDWSMAVNISCLSNGTHKLSVLSESFGYSNLIGRFGNSGTGPKTKGITGDVVLALGKGERNASLVDGRDWLSFPGLHGETLLQKSFHNPRDQILRQSENDSTQTFPTWYSSLFGTPTYDPSNESLFIEISQGRGHLWLNGIDLGRFWNTTRGATATLSQSYYFLPPDFLRSDGQLNEIVIFDVFGSAHAKTTRLVLSTIVSSDTPNFKDEVSYPFACV